jgi:hypothetical protein
MHYALLKHFDQNKVDHAVEILCACGCNQVNGFINSMNNGENPNQVRHLNQEEKAATLAMLVDVMDTYKNIR